MRLLSGGCDDTGSLPLAGPIVVKDTLPVGEGDLGSPNHSVEFFWATNPADKLDETDFDEEFSAGLLIGEWPAGELPVACTVEGAPETVSCQFGPGEVYGHAEQAEDG